MEGRLWPLVLPTAQFMASYAQRVQGTGQSTASYAQRGAGVTDAPTGGGKESWLGPPVMGGEESGNEAEKVRNGIPALDRTTGANPDPNHNPTPPPQP